MLSRPMAWHSSSITCFHPISTWWRMPRPVHGWRCPCRVWRRWRRGARTPATRPAWRSATSTLCNINELCCESGSGIRCLFDTWIHDPGWVKNQDQGCGSGLNNPDHISESLETIFWVKILKFFDADPGWEKLGSGINIPDPQHCLGGL
jgi:hypothetical protein